MSPWYLVRRLLGGCLVMLLVLFQAALGQGTGTIRGMVYDKASGDKLPGANVVVRNTSIGAATNLDGAYVLYNVPAGERVVIGKYIGYGTSNVTVNVPAGGTVTQDIYLTSTTIEGTEVVVTGQAQGQLQAINQQIASNKIVNVVSEAKIQELPDFNAAQAISRLPGVSTVESAGEASKVVIRGIAPQYNRVAVSGISLASTGSTQIGAASQGGTAGSISQDRSVDLTMVTPYMIKTIEVFKTLTPDMNANAVGGYVNMELREAPSDLHGDLMWQSGYTSKSNKYGNYRVVASVSDRFFEDALGVYALGNLEQYDRDADNMTGSYVNALNLRKDNGFLPVRVTSVGLQRHTETRKRGGGNLILDYRLPNGSIRSINMFSRLTSDYKDYVTSLDYLNHNFDFSYREGVNKTDLAVNSLELTNDFGFMSMNIKAANTYSRNFLPKSPYFQFRQSGGAGSGTTPSDYVPENLVTSLAFRGAGDTYLTNLTLFSASYKENDQIYKADFKIPYSLTSDIQANFKFGGEFRYDYHTNEQSTPYARVDQTSNIQRAMVTALQNNYPGIAVSGNGQFAASNFTSVDGKLNGAFLDNRFGSMFWIANPTVLNSMVDFLSGYTPVNAIYGTGANAGGWFDGPYQHLPNNYKYIERYYAGYVMADLDLGSDLKVVGGVRFEEVRSLFEAINMADARNPLTQTWTPVTVYPTNHFWLPMAQAKYNIADWLDVRYAYTQTLARPDYSQMSPHFNMDVSLNNVWAGNPRLVPAQAFNHDVLFTLHNNELGLLSVGAFYKTIRNFAYYTSYNLHATAAPGLDSVGSFTPRPKEGATIYTYINSPYDAYVRGVEVDFQTRFWYLPAPFDGMVFGVNYTHIWSSATYPLRDDRTYFLPPPQRGTYALTIDSSRTGRLINQPDDILNAYIGYDYEGFSARLSCVFQGNSVSSIGRLPEQDGFTKDYFRVDASARQMLPWAGLQVYLDVTNINARRNAAAQESIGGFTLEQNYGLVANLGVRCSL